jgi:hypothetical protein
MKKGLLIAPTIFKDAVAITKVCLKDFDNQMKKFLKAAEACSFTLYIFTVSIGFQKRSFPTCGFQKLFSDGASDYLKLLSRWKWSENTSVFLENQ